MLGSPVQVRLAAPLLFLIGLQGISIFVLSNGYGLVANMQFAQDSNGQKLPPSKNARGVCPLCAEPVIAKCGSIKVHHWAHVSRPDCHSWFEPETEWHRSWKARFPLTSVEVTCGDHRADIRHNGLVVELQHSPISPAMIAEREKHYGRMIWIVDAAPFIERFFLMRLMGEDVFSFKWKNHKSAWRGARRPVYFDFGSTMIRDILGAQLLNPTVYRPGRDEIRSHDRVVAGRMTAEGEKKVDPSLQNLPVELAERTILRKLTLHENGYGSARALRLEDLLGQCGVS